MGSYVKTLAFLLAIVAFASEAPAIEIESQLQDAPVRQAPSHDEMTCVARAAFQGRVALSKLPNLRARLPRPMHCFAARTMANLVWRDWLLCDLGDGGGSGLFSLRCMLTI